MPRVPMVALAPPIALRAAGKPLNPLQLPAAACEAGALTLRVACLAPVDQMELRNRLVMATQMWREATDEPLPRMPPGPPNEQLQTFELKLVDMLCAQATPQTARDVADKTWDLVHDRAEDDPVKRRVVECHEALARLSARGGGPES